jgi:microsomal dipeptidase-like Zn-dependent dipeptidase
LKADLVFVSKYFHVDYELLEKNLRKVLEHTKKRFNGKVVLVYGDLCLGQNGEMKKLAEEYGVVKVNAVNCIDCQLGGEGKFLEADPEHDLMFMGPGMIGFFKHMKEKMLKEGIDEAVFADLFSGIKGIVLLDTCGNAEKCLEELEKSGIGLSILETREIGLENVMRVVLDAIEHVSEAT